MKFKLNFGLILFIIGLSLLILIAILKSFFISEEFDYFILLSLILIFSGGYVYFFQLKSPFLKAIFYVKSSKQYIYLAILVFFIFALIGFFVPVPDSLKNYMLDFIKELVKSTQGLSYFGMIKFLFSNNLQSSFIGIVSGAILSAIPMFFTIINGYFLGFVAAETVKEGGILTLWRILPHGIFELPAIFISFGLGLKFGTFLLQKDAFDNFRTYFLESLRAFLFIVVPLLILAAIIEGSLIFFFS